MAAALTLAAVCSSALAARTTVLVDAAAPAGGNGTSWALAFRDLQSALAVATSSTDLWLADGVYVPTGNAGPRTTSFVLPPGARIYGGFSGNETAVEQRNPAAFPTILSGEIGAPADLADNSYHVLRINAGTACVVDGVTITRGNANGAAFPDDSGGGVLVDGNAATFNNVTFFANSAKLGAGAFVRAASPVFTDCVWRRNIATQDGGGAALRQGATIRGGLFDGNTSVFGGALLLCCGTTRIDGVAFRGNHANKGGSIYTTIGTLLVSRCAFQGNAAIEGGALFSAASGTQVFNSRFIANAGQTGGAIHVSGSPTITNCGFSRNFASISGGAVYNAANAPAIVNCTMIFNTALTQGGGFFSAAGAPVVRNSILWSNSDNTGLTQSGQLARSSGTLTLSHNCITGWNGTLGGTGNIPADPMLLDPDGRDDLTGTEDDDFTIAAGSPCIDAADKSVLPADAADLNANNDLLEPVPIDLNGCPRVLDDPSTPNTGPGAPPMIDMGAVEFSTTICAGDTNGDGLVNGADLSVLLAQFGAATTPGNPPDFNGDGLVNAADLSVMLSAFGTMC